MAWLINQLIDAAAEACSQFIVDMMSIITDVFSDLLSCDLDLFENLFGVVGTLYHNAILPIGIALLILIYIWQLFKSMFGQMGMESEAPIGLTFRTGACLFAMVYARQIINYILSVAGTPYQWIAGTEIEISSFAEYVTLLDRILSVLAIDSISVTILALLMQLVVAWNYFRLLFAVAERYVLLGVLSYTSPLAFAMGGSKSTNDIFSSWCRMFGGQVVLMLLNAWSMKMFLSGYGNLLASGYGFTKFFAASLCLVGFCRIALKLDSYLGSLGVNLGRPSGGMGILSTMLAISRMLSPVGSANGQGAQSGGGQNPLSETGNPQMPPGGGPIPSGMDENLNKDPEEQENAADVFGTENSAASENSGSSGQKMEEVLWNMGEHMAPKETKTSFTQDAMQEKIFDEPVGSTKEPTEDGKEKTDPAYFGGTGGWTHSAQKEDTGEMKDAVWQEEADSDEDSFEQESVTERADSVQTERGRKESGTGDLRDSIEESDTVSMQKMKERLDDVPSGRTMKDTESAAYENGQGILTSFEKDRGASASLLSGEMNNTDEAGKRPDMEEIAETTAETDEEALAGMLQDNAENVIPSGSLTGKTSLTVNLDEEQNGIQGFDTNTAMKSGMQEDLRSIAEETGGAFSPEHFGEENEYVREERSENGSVRSETARRGEAGEDSGKSGENLAEILAGGAEESLLGAASGAYTDSKRKKEDAFGLQKAKMETLGDTEQDQRLSSQGAQEILVEEELPYNMEEQLQHFEGTSNGIDKPVKPSEKAPERYAEQSEQLERSPEEPANNTEPLRLAGASSQEVPLDSEFSAVQESPLGTEADQDWQPIYGAETIPGLREVPHNREELEKWQKQTDSPDDWEDTDE